jgi:hypothetical protein
MFFALQETLESALNDDVRVKEGTWLCSPGAYAYQKGSTARWLLSTYGAPPYHVGLDSRGDTQERYLMAGE